MNAHVFYRPSEAERESAYRAERVRDIKASAFEIFGNYLLGLADYPNADELLARIKTCADIHATSWNPEHSKHADRAVIRELLRAMKWSIDRQVGGYVEHEL